MTLTNYFRSTQVFIFLVLLTLLPLHDIDGVVNVSMALSLIALIPDYRNLYLIRSVLGFWALFAIWYLASSLWNQFPEHTYSGLRKEVLYSFICLMIGFTAALHLKKINTVLYAVLISLTLLTLATMARGGVSWIGFMAKYYPSVGDGSTSLTFFFAIALSMFCVKKKHSVLSATIITIICVGLTLFYENRMIFITFSVMSTFCFLYMSQSLSSKAKFIGLTVMIITFLLSLIFSLSLKTEEHSRSVESTMAVAKQDPRVYMWDFYIAKVLEKPITGYGSGYHTLRDTFSNEFPENFNHLNKDHAHNIFLNKWLQMGGIGVLLFLALYSSVLYKGLRSEFSDDEKFLKLFLLLIFVGFFSKSMTDDFFIRNNLLLFWLVTGLILGRERR